jgi:molybdate transport system substrate-binding protein
MLFSFSQKKHSIFLLIGTWLCVSNVWADTFKVLTTGAFKQVVVAVAADYQKRTGHSVEIQNDTAGAIAKRVAAGESFDVVVLPPAALNAFASSEVVDKNSVISLAKVGIGVAVKEGTAHPPLTTVDDFKRLIANARRVALINPASGGSSGIYLEGLFQRMGIADEVTSKAVLVNGGLVAEKLLTGEADVAIHQISEILPVTGAALVGPLPESIQNYTTYAAALHASSPKRELANAFLQSFSSAQGSATIREKGMLALSASK